MALSVRASGGNSVLRKELSAKRLLESFAGPAEKSCSSIGSAADKFRHFLWLHSLQLKGEDKLVVLIERTNGAHYPIHRFVSFHFTVSRVTTGNPVDEGYFMFILVTLGRDMHKPGKAPVAFSVCVPLGIDGNPASPGFCLRLAGVKRSAMLHGLENGVLKQVLQLFRRQSPSAGSTIDFDIFPYGFENLLIGNGFTVGGGKCGIRVRVDVLHSASNSA